MMYLLFGITSSLADITLNVPVKITVDFEVDNTHLTISVLLLPTLHELELSQQIAYNVM